MLNPFSIFCLILLNQFSTMDYLLAQSRVLVARTSLEHIRFLHDEIRWDWRLIGIKGARGVGKTTLMLQRLRMAGPDFRGVYLFLDDLHFATHSLRATVESLRASGITHFFLDEVHKYPGWSRELKNLYDLYPDIFIVFTGSSIIELGQQDVDLSRRAILYELPGLSFREYLLLCGVKAGPAITFDDLVAGHEVIVPELVLRFRPLKHFPVYLREGYYPFFLENRDVYPLLLKQVVRLVLETDLAAAEGGRVQQTQKIGQLLQIIADSVPFKPNIQQLAARVQLDRNTLIRYLQHLGNARLIALLYPEHSNLSALQKPEKIFLENTNLAFALSGATPEAGSLRETFFYNQVSYRMPVAYTAEGDFRINNHWIVEVGGKSKDMSQIRNLPNSFLALDLLESGAGNKLPLWLFGFLY